jgi:AraC-like DNA-binding protein
VRKLFEEEGTTFTEFVLESRLAQALQMLSDPRLAGRTISSIAFSLGFGDLSYFNRTFRRRFGAAPSEMRTKASNGDPR